MIGIRDILSSGIAVTAPMGTLVTVVEASSQTAVKYSITSMERANTDSPQDPVVVNKTTFYIGPSNGTVYSNALMTKYKDHYFTAGLKATGLTGFSAAELRVSIACMHVRECACMCYLCMYSTSMYVLFMHVLCSYYVYYV